MDLLVTTGEDDSVRLYDIANGKLLKTTHHKKHGADRICFTHHPSSVICSSTCDLDSGAGKWSLRYLSMYDNRCLRYFKGHKDRVVSLCTSPVDDSFMSGSLDHSVRIWDLRVNSCQGILHLRGRPTVAYDQQGLVFAVSWKEGPFDTFLVGGDLAEIWDIKFSNDGKSMLLTTKSNNIYVLDAYTGEKRCGFSVDASTNSTIEATFTPDGQYVVSGSGDGMLNAWGISTGGKEHRLNLPESKLGTRPEANYLDLQETVVRQAPIEEAKELYMIPVILKSSAPISHPGVRTGASCMNWVMSLDQISLYGKMGLMRRGTISDLWYQILITEEQHTTLGTPFPKGSDIFMMTREFGGMGPLSFMVDSGLLKGVNGDPSFSATSSSYSSSDGLLSLGLFGLDGPSFEVETVLVVG
ncbi:hypothetical protein E3N88_24228 [Mikania micrantha]|uniref:Uncharacterized protein n=1 Tax=Mikania micrantha TaxID=192012 RepID=A0A5N6NHU9_9ASTR|nr:hypothetical protein E3N88_24228 [Mikania micrantha]